MGGLPYSLKHPTPIAVPVGEVLAPLGDSCDNTTRPWFFNTESPAAADTFLSRFLWLNGIGAGSPCSGRFNRTMQAYKTRVGSGRRLMVEISARIGGSEMSKCRQLLNIASTMMNENSELSDIGG